MKRRLFIVPTLLLLVCSAFAGDKKDKKIDAADLHVIILKADTGKPIRNASVVLHPVDTKGKQEAGGLQLKTDGEGKADYNGVPFGKLRIQVIAQGFQTFGDDYQIDKETQVITIKMNRPKEQYSIYK